MSESFVQVASDGAGKQIDTFTSGTGATHRQVVVLGDPATAAAVAGIKSTPMLTGEYGLNVRGLVRPAERLNITGGNITSAATTLGPTQTYSANGVTVAITGVHAGINMGFWGSVDGSTYFPLVGVRTDSGYAEETTGVLATNSTRAWDINLGNCNYFKIVSTAWTSGAGVISYGFGDFAGVTSLAATVQGPAANNTALLGNPVLCGGSNGTNAYYFKTDTNGNQSVIPALGTAATRWYAQISDGTNSPAIKAASTAAVATDPALVVTPSPNGVQTIQGVQDSRTTGAIIASTTVVGPLSVTQRNVVTITVSGTYAGVTFIIECSDDGGTTWFPLQCINNATGQAGSSWTPGTNATASYDAAIGGYTHCRVRATAWTSGSASVGITAQSFAYDPVVAAVSQGLAGHGTAVLGNPVLCGGSNGTNAYYFRTDTSGNLGVIQALGTAATRWYAQISDGTNSPAIKAASTPAAAADPGLVVTLSPNLPVPTTTFTNSAATTNATSIKASAGTVYGIVCSNINAATRYVKFYNLASAPTVGTSVPVFTIAVPTGGTISVDTSQLGIRFATGIALAITGAAADSDTTAVAANDVKVATTFL